MNTDWKTSFKRICLFCHSEVKKTTEISKRMISASKTSSELNEAYQELGNIAYQDIKRAAFEWKNPQANKIIKAIDDCENNLQSLEDDVVSLKSKNN